MFKITFSLFPFTLGFYFSVFVSRYYHLAHAVNERVTRQPSMLRAGTLRDYQLVGCNYFCVYFYLFILIVLSLSYYVQSSLLMQVGNLS